MGNREKTKAYREGKEIRITVMGGRREIKVRRRKRKPEKKKGIKDVRVKRMVR